MAGKHALLSGSLTALALVAAPARADGPKLRKGPYMTNLSPGGVDVRFELDGDAAASVEVKPPGSSAPARADPAVAAMHLVHLTGLEPAKSYAFDVRAGGAVLGSGHFTTAPRPDAASSVTFLVYGDDRTDPVAHAAVVRTMMATPSDFLVNTGDAVEDGGREADWQSFFDVEAPLLRERPIFLAIGNHELYDDTAGQHFARYFGFLGADGTNKPYGTVRVGPVRFFFLNGMHDWGTGEERQWLEGALAQADKEPGLRYRVAVMHHGPASSGPHGPNPYLVAAHVPELLAAHHVDVAFSGHDHIYERGEFSGLKYVVSGGGGAPLYRVFHPSDAAAETEATYHFLEVTAGSDAMHLVVHRVDQSILEKCTLRSGQPWDCTAGSPPPGGTAATAASPSRAPAPAPSGPAAPAEKSTSRTSQCGGADPGVVVGGGIVGGAAGLLGLVALGRRRRRPS
jgi:MYXO-CTERM domain-containing protein